MITNSLIITCEECGRVEHFKTMDESASKAILDNYKCPNSCSSSYLSYITIGQIEINPGKTKLSKIA